MESSNNAPVASSQSTSPTNLTASPSPLNLTLSTSVGAPPPQSVAPPAAAASFAAPALKSNFAREMAIAELNRIKENLTAHTHETGTGQFDAKTTFVIAYITGLVHGLTNNVDFGNVSNVTEYIPGLSLDEFSRKFQHAVQAEKKNIESRFKDELNRRQIALRQKEKECEKMEEDMVQLKARTDFLDTLHQHEVQTVKAGHDAQVADLKKLHESQKSEWRRDRSDLEDTITGLRSKIDYMAFESVKLGEINEALVNAKERELRTLKEALAQKASEAGEEKEHWLQAETKVVEAQRKLEEMQEKYNELRVVYIALVKDFQKLRETYSLPPEFVSKYLRHCPVPAAATFENSTVLNASSELSASAEINSASASAVGADNGGGSATAATTAFLTESGQMSETSKSLSRKTAGQQPPRSESKMKGHIKEKEKGEKEREISEDELHDKQTKEMVSMVLGMKSTVVEIHVLQNLLEGLYDPESDALPVEEKRQRLKLLAALAERDRVRAETLVNGEPEPPKPKLKRYMRPLQKDAPVLSESRSPSPPKTPGLNELIERVMGPVDGGGSPSKEKLVLPQIPDRLKPPAGPGGRVSPSPTKPRKSSVDRSLEHTKERKDYVENTLDKLGIDRYQSPVNQAWRR